MSKDTTGCIRCHDHGVVGRVGRVCTDEEPCVWAKDPNKGHVLEDHDMLVMSCDCLQAAITLLEWRLFELSFELRGDAEPPAAWRWWICEPTKPAAVYSDAVHVLGACVEKIDGIRFGLAAAFDGKRRRPWRILRAAAKRCGFVLAWLATRGRDRGSLPSSNSDPAARDLRNTYTTRVEGGRFLKTE